MGEIHNNKQTQNSTSAYYVNDDGSVSKKTAAKPKAQPSSFIVNEDGSVTKRAVKRKVSQSVKQPQKIRTSEQSVTHRSSSSVVSIGSIIWIIATVIFFILLIINTYEEDETIVDWIEILIGLSFFSGLIYSIIIRPFLNWLNDLF